MEEWKDEIVEEVRSRREAYARRFGYDVRAICQDLKARQDASLRTVVPADASDASSAAPEDRDSHLQE